MPGATVFKLTCNRVEPGNKKTSEWNHRSQQTDVTIYTSNNELWFRRYRRARTHKTYQMRGPHPCCQSFTTHISQCEDDAIASLLDRKEVAGEVADSKDLARDIKISVAHETWRTKTPMDLRRLKDSRVQFGIILLQRR